MAYDRRFWKLTFGGGLGYPVASESWQSHVDLALPLTGTALPAPEQSDVDGMWTELFTWFRLSNSGIGQGASLLWAKLVRKDLAGKDDSPSVVHEWDAVEDDPPNGGDGTGIIAYEVAFVASLRSGERFGRANYGRCYLPQPNGTLALGNAGRFNNPTGPCTNFAAMLEGLAGVPDAAGAIRPVIMSFVGAGACKRVAQVVIDDLPDTQRRRGNQMSPVSVLTSTVDTVPDP